MQTWTRLAAYAISLVAGFGTLILLRKEHEMFRTGMACAALVFTAGIIALLQHNLIGAGLILAPPFIMGVVTWLLPRETSSIEVDPEADEPQRAPVIDPGPPKLQPILGRGLGLVRYALAGLVLALVVQTFGPRPPQYDQLGDTIGDAVEASVAAVDRAAHLNLAFEPGPEIECRERSGAPGYQDACDAP